MIRDTRYDIYGNTLVEMPDINRDESVSNIINIETKLILSLYIKLYGVKKEDDVEKELKLGNIYTITFVTENGVYAKTGKLIKIDADIPQQALKLVPYNSINHNEYIILDCSENKSSEVVKIHVRSIRGIVDFVEPTPDDENKSEEPEGEVKDPVVDDPTDDTTNEDTNRPTEDNSSESNPDDKENVDDLPVEDGNDGVPEDDTTINTNPEESKEPTENNTEEQV